ncbi:MAG: YbbR-like domain-containing protein [Gemmatimonadota bacterium]
MRRLLDAITHNWALKLAALLVALLLWSLVRAEEPFQRTEWAPVEVEVADPDWQLAEPPQPDSVEVTFSGPFRDLWRVGAARPRVIIPVQNVTDTTELRVLSGNMVRLQDDLGRTRVEALHPNTVTLRYEALETRAVPVRATTRGQLPAGFALEMPLRVDPSFVQVRGPAARVRRLDSLDLSPIDLSDIRGVTVVPTTVDTARIRGLVVSPADVSVTVRVVPTDTVDAGGPADLPPPMGERPGPG